MGKIKMRDPDGNLFAVDAAEAREAMQNGWTQDLSGLQQLGKGVSDWAPPIGAGVGAAIGAAGGATGAAIPTMGAGAVPGGVYGGMAGGTLGGLTGSMAREAGYDAFGILKDENPIHMAARIAYDGASGLAGGAMQGVGAVPRVGMAHGAMKGAIGEAQIGTPQTLLDEGIQVSVQGLARVRKLIDAARAQKAAALRRVGQSWRVSPQTFQGAMQRMVSQAERSDIVSPRAKEALQKALAYLDESIGPKVTGGQTTGVLTANGTPYVTPRVVTPAKPLTLARVEEIRAWAAKQIKAYRQANGFAPSGPPDPVELGYRAVEETARNLVNGIRTKAGTVGDMNARISRLIRVGDDLTERLQRPTPVNPVSSSLSMVGGAMPGVAYGAYAGNPMLGAELGLMGAGLGQAANYIGHDPRTLSRIALALQNPSVGRGVMTQLPVRALDAYGRLAGVSDPQARPASPFGDAYPDGTR